MSTGFLSYEDELEISDRLYARKQVLDYMVDNDIDDLSSLSAKDQGTVERGNEAAGRLVEAYTPFAWSCARSVYNSTKGNGVSIEDLFQEAKVAMLESSRAYDARGVSRHNPKGRSGRRFGSYCRPHVIKKVTAFQSKSGFHLSAGAKRIQDTARYHAVLDYLEASLGRQVSDEEVYEYSGISLKDTTGDTLAVSRPVEIDRPVVDDDSGYRFDIPSPSRDLDEIVSDSLDSRADGLLLSNSLSGAVPSDVYRGLVSYLGLDRGFPRETGEVAEDLGITKNAATRLFNRAAAIVRHPQIRVALRNRIVEEAEELMTEIPGENFG